MTKTQTTLFCLPYAGGDSRIYRDWPAAFDPRVMVCAPELPGRGKRCGAPAFRDMARATEYLYLELERLAPSRVCLFGHSMGALLAFELAKVIEARRPGMLAHLFVSAHHAPRLKTATRPVHTLEDDALIEALRELGGTPDEVLDSAELMTFLTPTIRADFEMCENYRYRRAAPLAADITALSAIDDRRHSGDRMTDWRFETTGAFESFVLPGSHFFIHSAHAELLSRVRDTLSRVLAWSDAPEQQPIA
ncbi:alpha/beta fold hydrolase [Burkholderia sp. FERM BP-3421]|jgi:medium-chain acyl-[acyl-carrier-protein] hydrolase|uniref:thioesterase II family protein n=1 Tax=Burkholderia sp. FERM BP-3421 TaxID=1494466 RepID=UPI00235EC547|nr:alpha/beta fold hydrolase [Burkholderia sp. FERM BP-3421]WDD92423.1 alpha/beta fold hydrolase [Burkholderia sp. FERM BP-3421]